MDTCKMEDSEASRRAQQGEHWETRQVGEAVRGKRPARDFGGAEDSVGMTGLGCGHGSRWPRWAEGR